MDTEPARRTVRRRRRHRPPVITGDGIDYPPAPYTFEARVGTLAFLGRSLRRRGFPTQHRWVMYIFAAALAVPLVAALLTSLR